MMIHQGIIVSPKESSVPVDIAIMSIGMGPHESIPWQGIRMISEVKVVHVSFEMSLIPIEVATTTIWVWPH